MGDNKSIKTFKYGNFEGNLEELAAYCGINARTLQTRLRAGWPISQACETPVKKTCGAKVATCISLGKYRNTADNAQNWFGVHFTSRERTNEELAVQRLRRWSNPKFYKVGSDYTGTLTAISMDFKCPLSQLRKGLKDGFTPEETLRKGGYIA